MYFYFEYNYYRNSIILFKEKISITYKNLTMLRLIYNTISFQCMLLLMVLDIGSGHSQTIQNIDSLIVVIAEQDNDSSKLKNLLIITREIRKIDPVRAIDYADQSLRLSIKLNYPQGEVDAFYEKCIIYKSMGRLDSALYYSEKAIAISDSINDSKRLADNLLNYGHTIRKIGETEKAFLQYKKVLDIYRNLNDSSGISQVYNALGIIYKIKGVLDSAAYYYHESIRIFERIGDLERISASMINLGIIYITSGDLENARKYLTGSIKYAENFNRINHLVIAYSNLGIVAYEENKFDQALDYYNIALPLSEQIQDKTGMANLYNNIGNIYFEQKNDLNKAYEYYNKSLPIFREIGYKSGILVNLMNIAVIYEGWKNFEQALIINDTCLQIAKEIGELDRQKRIYQNILAVYSQLGNYEKAFEYQTKYYELKDSIFNLEKAEVIADLTLKYEKEKDQARILILENENLAKDLSLRKRTNQRNIYLFSGIGTIAVILFLLIFYRQKARKDKIIAEQKIQQLEEEKKLLAAKFLVEGQEEERKRIAKELHDGLGVLLSTTKIQFTSIKDKSPENKEIIEKATKILEQATGDVRKISHNMMPGLLTRFGLFEAAEDLIDNLNETGGLTAICEITGDTKRLAENKEIMMYRVIQEMVNNTIKHAAAKSIQLKMNIHPEELKINYSDDGKGFNVGEKLQSKSIGLNSIQSRVNFLNGKLDIESAYNKGAQFTLSVPI